MWNIFKGNNKSNRRCSGVFIVNLEYIWQVSSGPSYEFEHINAGWNALLP